MKILLYFFAFCSQITCWAESLYPNNLKNWEFDKEAAQILERCTGESDSILNCGASEDPKLWPKSTPTKNDSSCHFGIYILDFEGSYVYRPSEFLSAWDLKTINFDSFQIRELSEISSKLHGTVEKLPEWSRAYQFKIGEEVLSTHYSSVFSWGSLHDSLKYYEIYDGQQNPIGHIEGKYDTDARAEFLFFNENNELFAKGVLSKSQLAVDINNINNTTIFKCQKHFKTNVYDLFNPPVFTKCLNVEYFWTIKKLEDSDFDQRFLWPFIAFISEVWWEKSL